MKYFIDVKQNENFRELIHQIRGNPIIWLLTPMLINNLPNLFKILLFNQHNLQFCFLNLKFFLYINIK